MLGDGFIRKECRGILAMGEALVRIVATLRLGASSAAVVLSGPLWRRDGKDAEAGRGDEVAG